MTTQHENRRVVALTAFFDAMESLMQRYETDGAFIEDEAGCHVTLTLLGMAERRIIDWLNSSQAGEGDNDYEEIEERTRPFRIAINLALQLLAAQKHLIENEGTSTLDSPVSFYRGLTALVTEYNSLELVDRAIIGSATPKEDRK